MNRAGVDVSGLDSDGVDSPPGDTPEHDRLLRACCHAKTTTMTPVCKVGVGLPATVDPQLYATSQAQGVLLDVGQLANNENVVRACAYTRTLVLTPLAIDHGDDFSTVERAISL